MVNGVVKCEMSNVRCEMRNPVGTTGRGIHACLPELSRLE